MDEEGPGPSLASAFRSLSGNNGTSGDGAINGVSDLPPAFPGSGGWITAENLHEHFDGEGNWLPGRELGEPQNAEIMTNGHGGDDTGLGPGAGNVRTRDDDAGEEHRRGDVDGNGEVDGADGEEEPGGMGEEAKWRRTG